MILRLHDFDFNLPEHCIAQKPLEDRTASKLFVLDRNSGDFQHRTVADLPDILSPNDVLVFNKSRVIPARLTGDFGEIFLAKSLLSDEILWQCLVRSGKKFPVGKIVDLSSGVQAEVVTVNEDGTRNIVFRGGDSQWFSAWLQKHGDIPQPPYVHDKIENPDRYQTVFSSTGQSVAAPTAGLHFTDELLEKLRVKGVETHFVHLDVGLGTFLPVKTENVLEHKMHSESFFLTEETAEALNRTKKMGKRIIAVGTTSVRVLESCSDASGRLCPQSGETNIFIYPGYKFKFVDAMFTNFHTPKSTLLMLVSAFAGKEKILAAYEEAKQKDYRFYSFGDAMLIV